MVRAEKTIGLLQEMSAELLTAVGGEICRSDIENGLGAGHALTVHPKSRSRAGDQHRPGELGVGVELQTVLDHMVLTVGGRAAVNHGAAVRQTAVITLHLFL